jgi:hypothetical protein
MIRPRLRLFHCQHGQGSVIQKLPPAELGYLVQQVLIHPRGGIAAGALANTNSEGASSYNKE